MKKKRKRRRKSPATAAPVPAKQTIPKLQTWLRLPKIPERKARIAVWCAVVVVLVGSAFAMAFNWPVARNFTNSNATYPANLQHKYDALVKNVQNFENLQVKLHSELASSRVLQQMLSRVQLDAAGGNFKTATKDIGSVQTSIDNWDLELNGGSDHTAVASSSDQSKFLPILLYHYTPPDFEQQLEYLEQHDYTVIDMDTAVQGLAGSPLPAKPVVITFDDGFADQMNAFAILQKHHMKATFYIINGGAESNWCIGAGRRYGDPSQPPGGCGDAYLTWTQVRLLDRSGLITIGGHTLDHENLATLSQADQAHEIVDSKLQIEQEIGHPIHHFAYPYGAYDDTTIQIVRAAGYTSAVTTLPSDYQAPGSEYTLTRIRDTRTLP